jgi:hypothetical protein
MREVGEGASDGEARTKQIKTESGHRSVYGQGERGIERERCECRRTEHRVRKTYRARHFIPFP